MYSSQANQSTAAPNNSSVSVLPNNTVGVEQDSVPTSVKSSVLAISVAQAQSRRNENGVSTDDTPLAKK